VVLVLEQVVRQRQHDQHDERERRAPPDHRERRVGAGQ
jgi:hypothetical protein